MDLVLAGERVTARHIVPGQKIQRLGRSRISVPGCVTVPMPCHADQIITITIMNVCKVVCRQCSTLATARMIGMDHDGIPVVEFVIESMVVLSRLVRRIHLDPFQGG